MGVLQQRIVADVRVSDTLDRLVVTPRDPKHSRALSAAFARARPDKTFKRLAEGICVPAESCEQMSQIDADLRWTSEAELFVNNRRIARLRHRELKHEIEKIITNNARAESHTKGIEGLHILDHHQRINVAAMTLRDGFGLCVFDEQGAGKTVTLIFAFDALVARDQADFALIVAPKSMIPEWKSDFGRFKQDLYKVELVTGSQQQKLRALRSGADVLVTNYETVVVMEQELRAVLRRHHGRAVLVVDESFYVKNLDAKRTKALRRLREWCGRAFVLCGTPAPNSPYDVVQQFNIVDFGLTFDGLVIPEDREQARGVVQRAVEVRGLYVRHLKTQVLPDLPSKRFNRILIPLEPDQKRLYVTALKDFILALRTSDDQTFRRRLSSFLAQRSALLQICSNPVGLLEGYSEIPSKLRVLDDVLEDLVGKKGEKVVIWSFYTASLNAIVCRYRNFNPARYDGSITDVGERRKAVRKFQEDDTTMLFVGNPAAAGAGLTLHRARFAIYESMSNQAAHYLQSLDRIHRRGQNRGVEYLILLCEGTIEIQEYARLTAKERAAQLLFKDQVDAPITREAMLEEAIAAGQFLGTFK